MQRVFVSDSAAEQVVKELKMSREKRRAIQSFSTEQLQRYVVDIYRQGFQAGCDAITNRIKAEHVEAYDPETEEVQIDWEDILALISEVKGVGPKTLSAIDQKLKEAF